MRMAGIGCVHCVVKAPLPPRAVKDALAHLGFHRSSRILRGFPHPSGGNGHRVRQFKSEYRSLRRAVHAW